MSLRRSIEAYKLKLGECHKKNEYLKGEIDRRDAIILELKKENRVEYEEKIEKMEKQIVEMKFGLQRADEIMKDRGIEDKEYRVYRERCK